MKKKVLIVMTVIMALIAGCGGKGTSVQGTDKPAQESVGSAQEKAETTAKGTETNSKQKKEEATQDAKDTSHVRHWRIKEAKLEGQTGPDTFEEFFAFDAKSGINDNGSIVSVDDENGLFLIKQEAAFYTYNLKTNEVKLITEGALDSKYEYDGCIYYYDTNYSEFVISDWHNPEPVETGEKVTRYLRYETNLDVNGFSEFAAIQESAKNGDTNSIYEQGIIVDEQGDLYDFHGNYITNVHLPKPIVGNTYTMGNAIVLIDENKLNVYRYGESIFNLDLPEGHWKCVDIVAQITEASEVSVFKALLYNFDNKEIWEMDYTEMDPIGINIPICEDVMDFAVFEEMLYWVDSTGKGYVNGWNIANTNMSTTDHAVGVSRYSEFKGFVMPDKGGIEHNGLQIFVVN